MVAMCILTYLEFMTKMAVVVCGITGKPFWKSGKEVRHKSQLITQPFFKMVSKILI